MEKGVESGGASPKPTKPKERKAKKAAKGSGGTSSRSSDGESKVVTAKVVERRGPFEETEEVNAAAVQGGPRVNAPGNQSGPYGPGRGYGNKAWQGAPAPAQDPDNWRTGPPRGSYGRPLVLTKRLERRSPNGRSWGCATSARRWAIARRFVPTSSVSGVVRRDTPCATAPRVANLQRLRSRVARCATPLMSRLRRALAARP